MVYEFSQQDSPLLVSVPHAGLTLTEGIRERLTDSARPLPDTDWHVHRLAESSAVSQASLLCAKYSRYVIDLNRGVDDKPLYAGPTTGLVPTESFDGQPLYIDGVPDRSERAERVERFWRPYHDRLAATLADIHRKHGFAILLDLHSIRGRVPRLFDGRLPDLNLGTNDGRSCDAGLERLATQVLAESGGFSHVVNGRFKGGHITRHYGRPEQGVHALQLEIAQACYMDEDRPEVWDENRARPLTQLLSRLVEHLGQWRPQ